MTEEIPEGMVPGEIYAFMKWSARCYKAAHEFMVAYNRKAHEVDALVSKGKMSIPEAKASLHEYERLDEKYEKLISDMKKTEAELREKYGEEYFAKH